MTDVISIHHENPQLRLIKRVIPVLQSKGVIVYPTDSGYAIGCLLGSKTSLNRIRRIRELDKDHLFTLLCRDLSEISKYARINTPTYRLLKAHTPGAYTFVLPATVDADKLLKHPKRKTIGVRIPSHPVILTLLEECDAPLLSVSLMDPEEEMAVSEVDAVQDLLLERVDMIIDSGYCAAEPTSIIDLTANHPVVLREGKGDIEAFI
jgi:tRNA threonylcarbamoyl adenosine modification protein (Sua5/YciO/YrdC/YwlC family)